MISESLLTRVSIVVTYFCVLPLIFYTPLGLRGWVKLNGQGKLWRTKNTTPSVCLVIKLIQTSNLIVDGCDV